MVAAMLSVTYTSRLLLLSSTLCGLAAGEVRRSEREQAAEPHRIAIIGGGIGGAAASYFLHQLTSGSALIDVYESGRVGGRLATATLAGRYYETGGAIIHSSNAYMVQFVKELGLSRSGDCPLPVGLFDGSHFVWRDSQWSVVTLARLLWRYGLDAYRLKAAVDSTMTGFERIYGLQSRGTSFPNVSSLLEALDPSFPALTRQSMRQYLQDTLALSPLVVDELVQAVTLCNYGQTPDVNAFVGSVSVAAASPLLWSVVGGNRQVPEQLLSKARASVLRRRVTEVAAIQQEAGGTLYQVTSVEASGGEPPLYSEGGRPHHPQHQHSDDDDVRTQDYDAVIVAAPLTKDKSDIRFVNISRQLDFPGEYERIVATLVEGKLRTSTFMLSDSDSVDEVLVTNPDLVYNCVGKQRPVDDGDACSEDVPDVYKVFSPAKLTDYQLSQLFAKVQGTEVIDWKAYPHYPSNQEQLGDFELQPGLYHLNAIEWGASAMELSAIAAKNVALLSIKYLTGDPNAGGTPAQKDEL